MLRRLIASALILSLALPLPLQAAMVSTESALERARISAALDRAEVQQQLRAYGVTPDEIRMRVAALSDAEAAELAARIESLPAGGIGLVGAIVLVFLVLLLTDILGYTKIFPFTRPVKWNPSVNKLSRETRRTCGSTRQIRSTGIRGTRRRSSARARKTSRSSFPSATPRATGVMSWRTRASRMPPWLR